MAKLRTITDYRVKAAKRGQGARYRQIEVFDASGGYRWTLYRSEALRLAGDLVLAAAETGAHEAAVNRLSEVADRLAAMKSHA
ncbi:hypothetical protein GTC6_20550 [Gordonia terrae C-6]|uniref:Uncharacterized protein n=1 Tax=Gordonia terrae C-6 TaxID=1316928 RepID=R7Y465_9ACTN|nr:hypothetical protein GTC6_20550 [Gordonia terrae C-6]